MQKISLWLALWRSIIGKCPNCGKGQLFLCYLKPVENCASCGEKFGHIRADDGPAWLTMLLTGHIMAPFILNIAPKADWPDWLSMIIWPGSAMVLILLILPRAKGLFIGFIWRSKCSGSEA